MKTADAKTTLEASSDQRQPPRGTEETKGAQVELQHLPGSAREREEQLRRALFHAPIPIILFAEDGEILLVSRQWSEISGYGPEELPNLDAWLERAHAENAAEVRRRIGELLQSETVRQEGQLLIRTRSGEQRDWQFGASFVGRLPDGRRTYVCMASDVTERQRTEQNLHHHTEELERRVSERTFTIEKRSAQLRALAAEVTQAEYRERKRIAQLLHDHLQQLLVAAKMRISHMRSGDGIRSEDGVLGEIDEMLNECVSASRSLVVDLCPPVLHDGGLGGGLEWLARQMQQTHGLQVDLEVAQDPPKLSEDMTAFLFEAVRELLFNIVKHAQTDRARVYVRQVEPDTLSICIEDMGRGFDAEAAEERENGDRGFGLFSIRERLEHLGGSVRIDSAPGRGCEVELLTPIGPAASFADAAAVTAAVSADHAPAGTSPGRVSGAALHVLLVDDHRLLRDGLRGLLKGRPGIEIVGEAEDGQQAVEEASRLRPDLVLMDVSMPRMNGIEATRQIMGRLPETRIIGLSMHDEIEIRASMLQAGADHVLTKGGPVEALVAAIESLFGRRES